MQERHKIVAGLSDALFEASLSKNPIEPIRDQLSEMTVDDAYTIQSLQLERHLQNGRKLQGHKIGLTSFAMQEQLGVDSPDFGFFLDNMLYEEGQDIPANMFISPKVEPELAFKLSKDISGEVSLEEVLEAVEEVYPAIEIIDSRIKDWDIKLVDTIADNASCGAIVIADKPLEISLDNLVELPCTLMVNGEVQAQGSGLDVMGNPVAPLAWLAKTLHHQGVTLKKGQFVLTGSFTKALPVVAGETITADYGDAGKLELTFS